MKKSMSRILSLALVLVMLVGVMPFALAAGTVEATGSGTTAAPGDTISASATYTPEQSGSEANEEITWTYTDPAGQTGTGASASYTVPADAAVGTTLTFTFTAHEGETVLGSDSWTYTVVAKEYTATASPASISLSIGDTASLPTVSVAGLTADDYTVSTWTCSGAAEIEGDTLVAKEKGSATLSCTVTLQGDKAANGTLKDGGVVTVEVEVSDDVKLTVTPATAELGYGKTTTVTATLTGKKADHSYNPSFSFSSDTDSVKVSNVDAAKGTCTLTGYATGAGTVTVTATYTDVDGATQTISKEIAVSCYETAEITVNVKPGMKQFTFGDENVFSSVVYNGVTQNATLSAKSLAYWMVAEDWSYFVLTPSTSTSIASSNVGTLQNGTENRPLTLVGDLGQVIFTQNANGVGGTLRVAYEARSSAGLLVAQGNVYIVVGGSAGDIHYATDYATAVTFDEDDFTAFWNASTKTGSLSYVVFDTLPTYGTLYTSSSKTDKVTTSMMFKPNYTTSSVYEDLDTVYYVPNSTLKTTYTVSIPFTAYGTGTQTLSGVVSIEINGSNSTITSRGVVFGSGTTSIADQMAAEYKDVMKTDLAYVLFSIPDVEDGRLYYSYDGIMNSARVTATDEFYVSPTTKQLSLDKVAFIPAAGTTGRVTISYTGYDKDGKNPYKGTVILTVTAKTKSAIFTDVTTSYSWAADSIDFLYYEDVVKGTNSANTLFSPANSITRGDFMLMLYRAFLEEDYGNFNVTSNFADVTKGTSDYSKETYQAVGVAKYLGIAKGDGTNYNPKAPISREEAMTLIYRTLEEVELTLEYTSSKTTASFTDYSKVSTYAQTPISYLIKHGVVIGSNGLINPKSNITRAEMAVILHRVLTY